MAMTGSAIAGLPKLAALLRGLAAVPSRVSRPLADALTEEIRSEFTGEQDPYGVAWAPLKPSTVRRKGGNTVILYRTGTTGAACYAAPGGGAGVRIVAGGAAVWHQRAYGSRPARPVLPDRGLPPKWRAIVAETVGAEFAKSLGRAAR